MRNILNKVESLFLIAALLSLIFPSMLFAKGLKEKIQQRISAPSNIQLNMPQADNEQAYDEHSGATARDRRQAISEELIKIAPAEAAPGTPFLSSYAIYQTDYKAELEENVVTVQGRVLFEVFKKGWTQLPLVKSDVGLIDVTVNKGASFVVMRGGKYYLMIDKPGRYNLTIEFLIKASREREYGPGSFSFEVMSAPISQFEFIIMEPDVQIFVEPAIKVELKKEPNKTVAWAVMPNTENITVRWTKALPKEDIAPVKLEPKAYLDAATYASVGEGVIRCQSSLNYSILQSELSNLRIAIADDVSVLEVKGRDLRDWKVYKKDGEQYLDVYLNFGVKGKYLLNLTYERSIGEGSVVAEVPWIRGIDVEREKGYIGIASSTNVELATNKLEGVTVIDTKELPSSIWSSTTNPILLAFKYLSHPFTIHLDVTRHEELPVLVATIDSGNYTTLLTEEGKVLTKATYQVRNNVKQFLRLSLPKDATLWSAFVVNKPVKPAKDKSGSILIPLEKSQFKGESIAQFPVEIVYLDKASKMNLMGQLNFKLPRTDIPMSELFWSVYLPYDYKYLNFSGDVKPTKGRGRIARQGAVARVSTDRMERKEFGKHKYEPEQMVDIQQFSLLQEKGVLPIKINIPQQGRFFSFSKLLVTEKDSPWLTATYISVFRKAHGLFWLLMILFIFGIFIKKFFRKATEQPIT